jgi:hypothetical protein
VDEKNSALRRDQMALKEEADVLRATVDRLQADAAEAHKGAAALEASHAAAREKWRQTLADVEANAVGGPCFPLLLIFCFLLNFM